MLKRLIASTLILASGSVAAAAVPLAAPIDAHARIILVSGGCGPAFHRNPFGACVPNGGFYYGPPQVVAPIRLPPPCPRGYHRDPDPARRLCYPNF